MFQNSFVRLTCLCLLTVSALSCGDLQDAGFPGTGSSGPKQTELSDGTIGSSCGTCQSGLQCVNSAQIPNGYCSKNCASDSECGSVGRCVSPACYRKCESDSDCRPGYACKTLGGAKVCDAGAPASSGGDCDATVVSEAFSGGCQIRLVEPAKCEEIDLTGGKTYWFGWSTDTTFCETPFKLILMGNPPSDQNSVYWSLSASGSGRQIAQNTGGIHQISAADLQSLTSDNGIYHWVVVGWYGSHPASRTFKVKK